MRFGSKLSLVVVAVVLVLAFVSCAKATPAPVPGPAATPTPRPETFKLRFAHLLPPGDIQGQTARFFAEEVKRRTNGGVTIEIGWSGAFGKGGELLDLTKTGAVDIAVIAAAYTPGRLPVSEFLNNPSWNFMSTTEGYKAYTVLLQEYPVVFEEEAAKEGIKPLYWYPHGDYMLVGTKRVTRIGDFAGKRIRTFGTYLPKMIEGLGGVPTTVLATEIYEAMTRGTLDFNIGDVPFHDSLGLRDVVTVAIENANFGSIIGGPVYMNLKLWNRLSPDIQDIIADTSRKAWTMGNRVHIVERARVVDDWRAKGIQFVRLPEEDLLRWRERVGEPLDWWRKEMDAKGLGDLGRELAQRLAELRGW